MKTRTQSYGFDAEWIWGLEVMDLIATWEWVKQLWQKLDRKAHDERALVLLYTPAAERMAVRALSTFARLCRQTDPERTIFCHWPSSILILEAPPAQNPGLLLLHRAPRFLNLAEFCRHVAQMKKQWRVVMSAPVAEWQPSPEADRFEVIEVPEEEVDYCEQKGKEIIAGLCGESPEPVSFSPVEQILLEAGVLEVVVPLSLLARFARKSPNRLWQELQKGRWAKCLLFTATTYARAPHVAFRGRWLADMFLAQSAGRSEVLLFELLALVAPAPAPERHFF